jgi:hypothetical protein
MTLRCNKLFWVGMLITLLHTALILGWSLHHGRLALPVYFDDSHSIVDGARRLQILESEGIFSFFKDYETHPPHAPGHSLLAAGSFLLFGLHEWAPYLTNALFFALVLVALHLALGKTNWRLQVACMLLLASTPIAGISILEFRSEVNVAVLGALGILLFITWSRAHSQTSAVASSLCFAACLLIKPAVFPYTLGLMGLCVIFHCRLLFTRGEVSITPFSWFGSILIFLCVALIPPLPHYLLDWGHITGYIGNIALSKESVWLRHDDFLTGLLFHVTGYPGHIMLGWFLLPSLLLVLMALLLPLLRRKQWPTDLPLLPLIFFTAGAYLGVAVNPMNQNYFGMTFHWLLLITAANSLCGCMRLLPDKMFQAASLGIGTLSLLLFFGLKLPPSIDFYREKARGNPAIFTWLQHSPELVMAPIRVEHAHGGGTKVWITAYTMINARTLEWYSLKAREPYLYRDFIESDWNAVPASMEWADYIIAPEAGTPSLESIVPNAKMSADLIASIDKDSKFRLISRIPSPDGNGGFRIYSKNK